MIKPVFDRIKSCSVWKFVLNPSWHCSLGPGPALFFSGRPTCSRAAHVRRPLLCSRTVSDTARPALVSVAPVQLSGCQAPFSPCLRVASPAPNPPSSSYAWDRARSSCLPFPLLRHRSHRELHCRLLRFAQDSPPEYPPLTTSPASRDLTHHRSPRGPLLHTGIALEHRRPALFGELRPACHSSSFGSCLMTAYPRRCHRSSPEPPLATIYHLRH
jgi:hypothetical protein